MTRHDDDADELVPVSVRLGAVVPPEDPEDWTRPLTWVVAIGMLAAPALALGWFWLVPPLDTAGPSAGTYAVAIALVVGAAVSGGTQIGAARAVTGTLGAGLLVALLVVIAGAVTAGERQVGAASPTLAHAAACSLAGLAGVVPAAAVGGIAARSLHRLQRGTLTGVLGALVTAIVLPNLF